MRDADGHQGAQFGNEHNFIWKRGDAFLHGKGATPAWRDADGRALLGLIPLNMAREILIVLGGDNGEFLSFAPHGAGRNLSRKAMLAPFRDAEGDIDPARVKRVMAETSGGLDIRWYNGNLRHATYLVIRDDNDPREIVREPVARKTK